MQKIIILLFLIFLDCQSESNLQIEKAELILDIKGFTLTQVDKNGTVISEGRDKSAFKIYKEANQDYFILKDEKIIYDDLKFVRYLGVSPYNNKYELQILDKKNIEKIIRLNSDVISQPIYGCGTAYEMATIQYEFSTGKTLDSFFIDIIRTTGYDKMEKKRLTLFEENQERVDEVCFINLKKHYTLRELPNDNPRDFLVIFKKDKKYGVAGKIIITEKKSRRTYSFKQNNHLTLYDAMSLVNDKLLVEKGGLVGYYGVSKIKYSSLKPFNYGLAKFTLVNGKTGYIDLDGREYYD